MARQLAQVSVGKGIVTPSGARLLMPARGYVAKLDFNCSPSVMMGDPVCSNCLVRSGLARRRV